MAHNFNRLKEHLLPLSEASTFDRARNEWEFTYAEYHDDTDHCPCGQVIKELCFIRNILNGNETYVGNVCVNRFMKIDTGNLFEGLRRIRENPDANLNTDLIEYARKMGYLYGDNEYTFLMNMRSKRKFTAAQSSWKRKIRRRVINGIVVSKTK